MACGVVAVIVILFYSVLHRRYGAPYASSVGLISFKSLISSFVLLALLSVYLIFAEGCCKVCLLADTVIEMFSMLQHGRCSLGRGIVDRN